MQEAIARLAASRWPGLALERIEELAGDASSRRYVRCYLKGGPVPTTVAMLMEDPGIALSSEELGVFGERGPREVPFVNVARYLARVCDAVPAIYDVAPDGTCILLEDVGDLTLWEAAATDASAWFERALELLARIQREARDDRSGCYAFAQRFDERLLWWELEHFLEWGVRPLPPRLARQCRAELARLAERLAAVPAVFCHRDYHAWNIHVQGERLRLLDFQDALLGPRAYDVASLLTDRITPRLVSESLELKLISEFERLVGAPLGSTYLDCALHRALKVIGRFHYLAEHKGKPAYLAYLPQVEATARRVAARIGAAESLAEVLAGWLKPAGGETR